MRVKTALILSFFLLFNTGCSFFKNMGGSSARANAVQALVTTTRSAVVLMTAAGIAYDAGAFGEPGSPRAEDTWSKISTESIRMNEALTAWSEAIKNNKDSSSYVSMVSQALAVIQALLPNKKVSNYDFNLNHTEMMTKLENPNQFRALVWAGEIQ